MSRILKKWLEVMISQDRSASTQRSGCNDMHVSMSTCGRLYSCLSEKTDL